MSDPMTEAKNTTEQTEAKTEKHFVAYYRVSTKKQALGLSAQKTMVKDHLKNWWPPVQSFTEKESGKSDRNRPELQKALEFCKRHDATLIVATLSRLSRDLHFITMLQKHKIKFVICDMPEANPLTINIMGAIAQYERETISKRTSRALQELKKQGKKLGSNNPKIRKALKKLWAKKRKLRKEREKMVQKKVRKVTQGKTKRQLFDEKTFSMIKVLRADGKSYKAITETLNKAKVPTRVSGKWHATQVQRIARRNNL